MSSRKILNTLRGKTGDTRSTQDRDRDTEGNQEVDLDAGFDAYFEGNINEGIIYDNQHKTGLDQPRNKVQEETDFARVNDLIEQVTQQVMEDKKKHPSPLVQDGAHTRYEKRAPSGTHNSEESLFPQPLQPRSASRMLTAPEEVGEGFVDALKASESIAILHEQRVAEMEAHKAALEAIEKENARNNPPILSVIKRKISSTFQKDTSEQNKSTPPSTPSQPQSSASSARKFSSSKPNARGVESLATISENDASLARASNASSGSSLRPKEPLVGISPRDSGFSAGGVASPSPQAKINVQKSFMAANDPETNENATTPLGESPAATSSHRSGRNRFDQAFATITGKDSPGTSRDVKASKPPSPRVGAKSPSIFSRTPTKPKFEKFKDSDAEVKDIERQILREEWGVNSTPQLTSAYVKKAPPVQDTTAPTGGRGHSNSLASTAGTANSSFYATRPRNYSTSTAAPPPIPPRNRHVRNPAISNTGTAIGVGQNRQASNVNVENTGSVIQGAHELHDSPESPFSAENIHASQDSTTLDSALCTSGDTAQATNIPQSPETPNTGTSFRITRKEVGSGNSRESSGGAIMSPDSREDSFGEHPSSFAQSSFGGAAVRSLAGPFDTPTKKRRNVQDTSEEGVDTSIADLNIHSSPQGPFDPQGQSFGDEEVHPTNTLSESDNANAADVSFDNRTMISTGSANASVAGPGQVSSEQHHTSVTDIPRQTSCTSTVNPLSQEEQVPANPKLSKEEEVIARNFQQAFFAGNPTARLRIEEGAKAERRRTKLSKQDYVKYKVEEWRKYTNTEIVYYDRTDPFPKHPNHGRQWHSKNLWCTRCLGTCPLCGAACCAWKEAALTVSEPKTLPDMYKAGIALQEIQRWVTVGEDEVTFLECTQCHKFVCVNCIGVCTVFPCFDRLCVACNPGRRFKPCAYHTDEDIAISDHFKRQMEKAGHTFN